ncbi:hypothetical protein MFUL124B02_19735 [Myxococcus fulvus 124B02]|nr:hypothetical protein MFUL124B02_19735 [Myxococcus fulvus 124B02]
MKNPSLTLERAPALLVTSALLLLGCQAAESPTDTQAPAQDTSGPGELSPLPVVLQQGLGGLRERTCREIKNARPTADDGEYALHLMGDAARPWRAYCHDMAGTPREYLTLQETGLSSNFSQYTAGGAMPGTTVRTSYLRLRIDPVTLRIDTSDRTFTRTEGTVWHGGTPITALPFATAMSCDWGDTGRANIDLRGTSFKVPADLFVPTGYAAWGSAAYSYMDQVVSLKGGGYCGWNTVSGVDPFVGGSLPVFYVAPTTSWVPSPRVQPASHLSTLPQTLRAGWYDTPELSVGDDAISSVHVPRGWKLTLHEHGGFQGASREYTADTHLTGTDFDQRASSLRVEAAVRVYPEPGFQGRPQVLTPGYHDLAQLTVGNDTIRSVQVPEGFHVTLYGDSGFSGPSMVLTQDTDLAGLTLDARTSSLLVESPTLRQGNTVHGHWLYSGGQYRTSADNRRFIVEYAGVPDIVTFELEANVDPYLYLLDAQGNVLTEVNNRDGGTTTRISYFLTAGTYQLVAATTLVGRTGDFSLRSDKARMRAPSRLWVKAATQFDWIYDDNETGADTDISVWRPRLSSHPGYHSLGDIAMSHHDPGPAMTFVVSAEGDLLAPPTDLVAVWNNQGAGGSHDVAFWRPIPPAGYTCLGALANRGYTQPDRNLMRCVRTEYVLPATPSWIWSSHGSGAWSDVSVFQTNASDHRGLTTSNMQVLAGLVAAEDTRAWALNKSMLANPELRGVIVNETTALQFAPRIWLHEDEYYWPSSAEFFLDFVHEEEGHLTTNVSLGCPSCTNPPFLNGQRPDQTHVPVYIQLVDRTEWGMPTNVTDIIYWTFYPYNAGKNVCIGVYIGIACFGFGYSTFGNHVGDWEHITLRFIDGRPAQVYMAQHAHGARFELGDKRLALFDGFRPEAYAAKGSHGHYPDAGRHAYQALPNGDDLVDDTSRGLAWNAWDRPVIFRWQPRGTFAGALSWLNISHKWGNEKDGCDNVISEATDECILNGGPTPPMWKSLSQPGFMTLE